MPRAQFRSAPQSAIICLCLKVRNSVGLEVVGAACKALGGGGGKKMGGELGIGSFPPFSLFS